MNGKKVLLFLPVIRSSTFQYWNVSETQVWKLFGLYRTKCLSVVHNHNSYHNLPISEMKPVSYLQVQNPFQQLRKEMPIGSDLSRQLPSCHYLSYRCLFFAIGSLRPSLWKPLPPRRNEIQVGYNLSLSTLRN